ncbi:MAG TPA: sulfotransferase, partial [Crenotrichaceae bacterium]|nr:sulfotransferase [Crenotrichaceae bacterium]
RDLWSAAYPETDIWSELKQIRNGRIVLTEEDEQSAKSSMLSDLFKQQMLTEETSTLIEKLPINNFRLRFINTIFPNARYIHIYRNALEVARSIETRCNNGKWFANNKYKWDELVKIAHGNPDTEHLPDLCTSYYDKGLLEWRLSTDAAVMFLDGLSDERQHELSYSELTNNPEEAVAQSLEFIGLDMEAMVRKFCQEIIRRKTSTLDTHVLTDKEIQIGGKLLERSIGTGGKRVTVRPRRLTYID